jgi:prophage antirepressor-like protein
MEIQVFNNAELGEVRTTVIDGEVMFVGKDVAEILGYQNGSKALADHVDEEDKLYNDSLSSLGQRGGWLINESGLYNLILSSKMPNAKKFKRWVTAEVLPAIRKHGVYAVDEVLQNPDVLIQALTELKKEREEKEKLKETVAVQNQQITEMTPKAGYYDVVLNCKDVISTTEIAKDYGWSAKKMNAYLHEKKIQFKQGKIWLLYQKYSEQGLTSTKTSVYNGSDGLSHSSIHTYWTQKGRLFIYELLKKDGILPIMERR